MLRLFCLLICATSPLVAADSCTVHWWTTGSFYAASYSSDEGSEPFHDLVTTSPRDGVGVNMIAASASLTYGPLYATATLQAGDVPTAVWQPYIPYVQEAWLGVHLGTDVRCEGGLFISHLGVESIIPFQNLIGIVSVSGYFDPNFFGGAKVFWDVSKTVTLHADVLTSYSGAVYEGDLPAFCASMIWRPDTSLTIYANSMLSDEPLTSGIQFQTYTNIYAEYRSPSIHALAEWNVGAELPTATLGWRPMTSGQLTIMYSVTPVISVGLRGECFLDPHGIMVNDRYASPLPFSSLNVAGYTASVRVTPLSWASIGVDLRRLTALDDTSVIDIDPSIAARTEGVFHVDLFLD